MIRETFLNRKKINNLKNNLKKSIYLPIFKYYFAVVTVIVILVGSTIYMQIKNVVSQKISEANIETLNLLSRAIEQFIINKTNEMLVEFTIYNGDELNKFSLDEPKNDMINISNIIKQITQIKNMNECVESIYLYNIKSGVIASTDGCIKITNEEKKLDSAFAEKYDVSWLEQFLNEGGNTPIWIGRRIIKQGINKKGVQVFSHITGYPTNSKNNRDILIAVNFYEQRMIELIMNFNPKIISNIIIYKGNENFIGLTGNDFEKDKNYDEIKNIINLNKYGNVNYDLNGKKFFITYTTSEMSGWKYVGFMLYEDVFGNLKTLNIILISMCILVWGIGIILAVYFSNKQHKPIMNIYEIAKRVLLRSTPLKSDMDEYGNEYQLITESIKKAQNRINELEKEKEEIMPFISDYFIGSIISNKYFTFPALQKYLAQYGIQICLKEGIIAVAGINTEKQIVESRKEEITKNLFECAEGKIDQDKRIKLILGRMYDGKLIFIITSNVNNVIDYDSVISFFSDLQEMCLNMYNIRLTVGISSKWENARNLGDYYEEAIDMLRLEEIYGIGRIYSYDKAGNLDEKEKNEIKLLEKQLIKCLNTEDIAGCQDTITNICIKISSKHYYYSTVTQIFANLVAYIIVSLKDKNNASKIIFQERDIMSELKDNIEISKFKSWILDILINTVEESRRYREAKNYELVERIKDYIKSNIMKDIIVDDLAGKLYLNPNYVRKIFKDVTGKTISEYIFKEKMEAAREMIINTDYKIETIAQNLSYGTTHYFIKKFKECYGMTPKEYRTQKRLEKF